MEKLIRWMIKKFMPGYHLAHNPPKGRKHGPVTDTNEGPGVADSGYRVPVPSAEEIPL